MLYCVFISFANIIFSGWEIFQLCGCPGRNEDILEIPCPYSLWLSDCGNNESQDTGFSKGVFCWEKEKTGSLVPPEGTWKETSHSFNNLSCL